VATPSRSRARSGSPARRVVGSGNWIALLLFYLGLGAASGLIWSRTANLPDLPSWHLQMLTGTAPAPNQYRPLTPWLAELLRPLMPGSDLVAAYYFIRSLVAGVTLFCFDRYLRVWFSPAAAAGGALCLAALTPFGYFHVVQESDPINLLVFVLAYWALARERDLLLIPLVLVGTLNRETTAMIPALYLVIRYGRVRPGQLVGRTAALAGAWAVVYGGMLLAYGRHAYYCDVLMLGQNLSSPLPTLYALLSFGALWVLALLGARSGPAMLRRALWLVPPYVVLHYIVAIAQEVRLYLPLAPILVPLSWCVLLPEARLPAGAPARARP